MDGGSLIFEGYTAFNHIIEGNPSELPRNKAQENYEHFIKNRNFQIPRLRQLLEMNGISLSQRPDDLQALNLWLTNNIKPANGAFGTDTKIHPMWSNIIFDLSIYLSEAVIKNTQNVDWHFNINNPKNEISYQYPVLQGFSKVETKGYYHNFGLSLFNYATDVIENDIKVEPNFLAYLLESAIIQDVDIANPLFDHTPFEL